MVFAVAVLAAALAWGADDSHKAPMEDRAASSSFAQRQNELSEMWQRGVLPAESQSFTPKDEELLARMHAAEAAGAVRYLRDREPLRGLVVELKTAAGRRPRLTKAGFRRWLLLRTQDVLTFFQSKDIGAKDAFGLKDLDGKPLFDAEGLVTPEGELVYDKVLAREEAHWVTASGEVLGNRPPPKGRAP